MAACCVAEPRLRSVARPLFARLAQEPRQACLHSRFEHACNLVDDRGELITLALPAVGEGPFSLVIEAEASFFERLRPGQAIMCSAERLRGASWQIWLDPARVWEPRLARIRPVTGLAPALASVLRPFQAWPGSAPASPIASSTAKWLACYAAALQAALAARREVAAAAHRLVGLGPGLTPAGDDYLLGVMAGLWLRDERELLPIIGGVAKHTTLLSAAFLRAAAQGCFAAPWHALASAFERQDATALRVTSEGIARIGASSGQDALAGLADTLLGR
jgi:hypothetical protein